MQNIPMYQFTPEMIQAMLMQGMYQPIEQANPYTNMLDPNAIAYAPQNPRTGYIYSYNELSPKNVYYGTYNPNAYSAGANKVSDKNSPFYGMTMEQIQQTYPNLQGRTQELWNANEGL